VAHTKKHLSGVRAQRLRTGASCGAKKKSGGHCTLAAGWGTSHPGLGKCKLHGGETPTHVRAAAKDEMRILLGRPIETTPEEAILNCIRIRSGEVQWLSDKMAELDAKDWTEDTMLGKQFHLFARERQAALRDVAKFSEMAIRMNIEERRVRIAETYGEAIATLLKGILDELMPHMDQPGRELVPAVVKRHLISIGTPAALNPGEKVA
jgi:hypothetical protein